MDQNFWNNVGGASNLGHAYRIVLDGLGYPVARVNNAGIASLDVHPLGDREIESAGQFALDYNEVAIKNPALGLPVLSSTYAQDLSDARYNALQDAIELVQDENTPWDEIVAAARQKALPGTSARTLSPGMDAQGEFPQPDPGDGPPTDEATKAEGSSSGTLVLLGLGVAAAFALTQFRK